MARLFVIDTETGGVDPSEFSILTFAGAVWDDGKILETIEFSVLEPQIRTEPEAMRINRIDLNEHRRRAIAPQEAIRQIDALLDRHFRDAPAPIAGHNVNFDVGFLKRLYRIAGGEYPTRFSRRHVDTASILAFLDLCGLISLAKPSLDNALRVFDIAHETQSRHTALGDVMVTCELINRMKILIVGTKPSFASATHPFVASGGDA
jgi:DNA polymerase III epsilon subunit-like protein